VRPEGIAADYQTMKLDEYRRAYMNQWPSETPEEWLVVPKPAWQAVQDPRSELAGRVAFAVDVNPDRTWAAIASAGRRADDLLHVEVVQHDRGTGWVVPRLAELADRWKPCALVIAPSGPANSLIPEAEAAGLEILRPSVADIAGACGAFYDATGANPDQPATLRHLGQLELTAALAGAARRDLGDRWLWARKGLAVDISPLVAVTLALWGHATRAHVAEEQPLRPFAFTR
jgi:hypothetical protein